jgi:hypothetical protein
MEPSPPKISMRQLIRLLQAEAREAQERMARNEGKLHFFGVLLNYLVTELGNGKVVITEGQLNERLSAGKAIKIGTVGEEGGRTFTLTVDYPADKEFTGSASPSNPDAEPGSVTPPPDITV